MKFCPECNMMLYFKIKTEIGDTKSLLYEECKHCNFSEQSNETIVSRTVHREDAYDDESSRQYMRYSKAVPRTVFQKCPNKKCLSHKNKKLQEAILIRKEGSMEQLYICVVCNVEWQTTM